MDCLLLVWELHLPLYKVPIKIEEIRICLFPPSTCKRPLLPPSPSTLGGMCSWPLWLRTRPHHFLLRLCPVRTSSLVLLNVLSSCGLLRALPLKLFRRGRPLAPKPLLWPRMTVPFGSSPPTLHVGHWESFGASSCRREWPCRRGGRRAH